MHTLPLTQIWSLCIYAPLKHSVATSSSVNTTTNYTSYRHFHASNGFLSAISTSILAKHDPSLLHWSLVCLGDCYRLAANCSECLSLHVSSERYLQIAMTYYHEATQVDSSDGKPFGMLAILNWSLKESRCSQRDMLGCTTVTHVCAYNDSHDIKVSSTEDLIDEAIKPSTVHFLLSVYWLLRSIISCSKPFHQAPFILRQIAASYYATASYSLEFGDKMASETNKLSTTLSTFIIEQTKMLQKSKHVKNCVNGISELSFDSFDVDSLVSFIQRHTKSILNRRIKWQQ